MRGNYGNLLSVPASRAIVLVCFCVLVLFAAGPVQASEQLKDDIVLDGGTHHLLNFPLGHAADWSKAVQATLRGLGCSGAWRGYKAFWEVRDEKLWLVQVVDDPCGEDLRAIPLNLIIPKVGSTPLPATWISGRLGVLSLRAVLSSAAPDLNHRGPRRPPSE